MSEFEMGDVLVGTDANFDELVLANPLPVVVDFYTDWCGPCRQLAPILRRLAGRYTGEMAFVKVNAEENEALTRGYNARAFPGLFFFCDGLVVTFRYGGDYETIRLIVDDLLAGRPLHNP